MERPGQGEQVFAGGLVGRFGVGGGGGGVEVGDLEFEGIGGIAA